MKFNTTHIIAAKDCKYTLKGQNLAEMRRADLRRLVAVPIGVDCNEDKNEILRLTMTRLQSLAAPNELTEMKDQ